MVQKRKNSSVFRGAAGRERADEELARQKARAEARKEQQHMPFRFRIAPGNTTEFIVVDDAPDFFRHEHNLKNPQTGIWDIYTGCTAEWDNCPVCEATQRESYYAMYLTVIDLTSFETKDGKTHDFSRKLLVVKPAQQKKFIRAYNKAEKEGRTLRGAVFEVTRDGDKDSAIGNDIEFVEFVEEDDLAAYVRTWKDREGKKHTEDCSVPYNYDELFEEPDSDKLRALVGGAPALGSREYERKALGRRSRDADDDDEGEGEGESRGGRTRRGAGYEDAKRSDRMRTSRPSREEPEDDDEPEKASSRRGSRRPAKEEPEEEETSTRSRRATRSARTEPEEEDDTPRRGSRRPAKEEPEDETPRRGSRRPSREEPEEEDENPPGRGRRLPMRGRR